MSDNITAVKLVALLATVILLANLMGIGASSPFQGLQNALGQGPGLPEFQDPFVLKQYVAHIAIPRANSPGSAVSEPPDDWLHGCSPEAYYECINTQDGNESYITLPAFDEFLDPSVVVITAPPDQPSDFRVNRVTVEVQARSPDEGASLIVALYNVLGGVFHIPIPRNEDASGPFHSEVVNVVPTGNVNWSNFATDRGAFASEAGAIDLSFFRITLYASAVPGCAAPPGAWFPSLDELACQVAQGVDWLITALQFVVNAVIFAFLYVGGWLAWAGTIIAGFLGGVVAMALWFLALEAPPVIQGFFGIITVVVIGFFSLVFIRLVRGSG